MANKTNCAQIVQEALDVSQERREMIIFDQVTDEVAGTK